MNTLINLFRPIFQSNETNAVEKKAFSSTLLHAVTSIAVAIIMGVGVALLAHFLIHITMWTGISGGVSGLLSGSLTYIILRCARGNYRAQQSLSNSTNSFKPLQNNSDVEKIFSDPSSSNKDNKIQNLFAAIDHMNRYDSSRKNLDLSLEEVKEHSEIWRAAKKSVAKICVDMHKVFYEKYASVKATEVALSDLAEIFHCTEEELKTLFKKYCLPQASYNKAPCLNCFFYHLAEHHASYGSYTLGAVFLVQNGNPLWPEDKDKETISTWEELADFLFSTPKKCKKALSKRGVVVDKFDQTQIRKYLHTLTYACDEELHESMEVLSFSDVPLHWSTAHQWARRPKETLID